MIFIYLWYLTFHSVVEKHRYSIVIFITGNGAGFLPEKGRTYFHNSLALIWHIVHGIQAIRDNTICTRRFQTLKYTSSLTVTCGFLDLLDAAICGDSVIWLSVCYTELAIGGLRVWSQQASAHSGTRKYNGDWGMPSAMPGTAWNEVGRGIYNFNTFIDLPNWSIGSMP